MHPRFKLPPRLRTEQWVIMWKPALFCLSIVVLAQLATAQAEDGIEGFWELVEGSSFFKDQRCLEFISGGRETWTVIDSETKQPKETAGGTYKLGGDQFTIRFEYAPQPKYSHFLLKSFIYRCTRSGDFLRITEERSGKIRLDQRWKLCK